MTQHHEEDSGMWIRSKRCQSWLDPDYQHKLAAELREKLLARCKGESGLFLTLTYRRQEWGDQRELYRCASEQRHVRRFMEALGKFLGRSLAGKWICKLEFQNGGWMHWHILLLGVDYIDHSDLSRMWGHGHVWVNRMSPKRIRYFCKYVAKGGDLPAWLYLEVVRSVKIIRVSPGFWLRPSRKSPPPSYQLSSIKGCGPAIGYCIAKARTQTVGRSERGTWHKFMVSTLELVLATKRQRPFFAIRGDRRGRLRVSAKVCHAAHAEAKRLHAAVALRSVRERSNATAAGRRLHLTEIGNPPDVPATWFDMAMLSVFQLGRSLDVLAA